jgi:acylphosphatase
MSCKRCLVSGHVQGVFFRASTREQAQRLGVTGYARNLPDGHVEVVACGPQERVADLCEWLQSGPPQAQVVACVCEDMAGESYAAFVIS